MYYHSKYDINGFAKDLGLTLQDVSELYAELIKEFNSALSDLETSIQKKELKKIQRTIHNIKGISGNYRITDIYKETTKINDLLKSNNYNTLNEDLNNLFNTITLASKEIKCFFIQKSISI